MICSYCGTELDGTGTCLFDCLEGQCGLCGAEVGRFETHRCPERRTLFVRPNWPTP